VTRDGSLQPAYSKIYGLEHIAVRVVRRLKGKCTERDITLLILGLEFLIIVLLFASAYLGVYKVAV